MFNSNFYPTPRHVLDRMMIDCNGKIVLEPSAGKGNIIDYVKEFGAKQVMACEIENDLQKIVAHKATLIADDFFKVTAEQVSHVELIVMNPPFDRADKHILHAWAIAPEGCEIIALCNWQTLDNRYSYSRSELSQLINDYGNKENFQDCFTDAERKTGVEVGCVHLFKPVVSDSFDYDGFYYTDDEGQGENGVMQYNDVRAIVNSYVAAVKKFEDVERVGSEISALTKSLDYGYGVVFKGHNNSGNRGDGELTTKAEFSKELQKHCWKRVFNKMGVEKIVTAGVMKDINAFVENRLAYPFTMRNIFRMIEIIVGNRANIMDRAIVEAVDNFTKHTHDNRFGVEGWKSNEGHLLNQKFICGWIASNDYGKLQLRHYSCRNYDHIQDLVKALCYVTGQNYDNIPDMRSAPCEKKLGEDGKEYWVSEVYRSEWKREKGLTSQSFDGKGFNDFQPNTWYDWGFFQFKVFKKGTGHFKFKDPKVWELLNRAYAKAKGQVLPDGIFKADNSKKQIAA